MGTNAELTHEYLQCWVKRDFKKQRSLLHDDFQFTGPMVQTKSADEFIHVCKNMGEMKAEIKVKREIEKGSDVAVEYDLVCQQTGQAVRMSEFYRVNGGKLESADCYFDPRAFEGKN